MGLVELIFSIRRRVRRFELLQATGKVNTHECEACAQKDSYRENCQDCTTTDLEKFFEDMHRINHTPNKEEREVLQPVLGYLIDKVTTAKELIALYTQFADARMVSRHQFLTIFKKPNKKYTNTKRILIASLQSKALEL